MKNRSLKRSFFLFTLVLRFFFFSYVSLSRVFPFSSSLRRAMYILCETRAEHGYKELLTAIKVLKVEVERRRERKMKQSFSYLKRARLVKRVDEPIRWIRRRGLSLATAFSALAALRLPSKAHKIN